jgi:hypothetical protein
LCNIAARSSKMEGCKLSETILPPILTTIIPE